MNQTTVLQKLTGKQRLLQALQLSDFVRELANKGKRSVQIKRKMQKLHE